MKRNLIASIVGGLIIFIWQFASYAALNLHGSATQYTEKQGEIMNFLASQNLQEGGYIMPSLPQTASQEEWTNMMKENEGKPWVSLQYHASLQNNMVMNMIRGFGVNIIIVFFFCYLLGKMRQLTMGQTIMASLAVGLIVFMNAPYTGNIWYPMFDINEHLLDAIVSWGLLGVWLGFWFNRGRKNANTSRTEAPAYEMAS